MTNKWTLPSPISGTSRFLGYHETLCLGIGVFVTLPFADGKWGHLAAVSMSIFCFLCAIGYLVADLIISKKAKDKDNGFTYIKIGELVVMILLILFVFSRCFPINSAV